MRIINKYLILIVLSVSAMSCSPRIETDEGQWGTHADITSGVFFYQWELENIVLAEGEVEGAQLVDVTATSEVNSTLKVVDVELRSGTRLNQIACYIYHNGERVEPINDSPIPGKVSDYSSGIYVYRIHSSDGEHIDWTVNVSVQ